MAISTITSAGIATDTLVAGDIAADAVGASEIAADAVGLSELNDATGVTSTYHKVPSFADDAARNTAIPSPAVGMLVYNTDIGAVQQYNGIWSTIAPAPNVTALSGFLNDDTDSTLTIFGTNFTSASGVKMFTASSGGSQIGSNATVTFVSNTVLKAVFGAGSIGAAGSTAYIEIDNAGSTMRFGTAITVNADPTSTHAGATGTGANTTVHLGTYDGAAGTGGSTDSNTTLLLNFERADGSTDFEDSSNTGGDGYKVTAGGTAHIETDQEKFGSSSAHFDGDSDYLQLSDSSAHDFGTAAFTIDFWAYWLSAATGEHDLVNMGSNCLRLGFENAGSDSWYFEPRGETDTFTSPATPPLNTWAHYAIVGEASTIKVYIDGVLKQTSTRSGSSIIGGANPYFGVQTTSAGFFHGYMDIIRISKGIARWTSAFTPPTALYGTSTGAVIPTITLTGAATQLAADEDIEFTSVINTTKAANNQQLTDSGIGLVLANLTGANKNKATLTGTIASADSTTHTNMPIKMQVRKTLGSASYNNSTAVTFTSFTISCGTTNTDATVTHSSATTPRAGMGISGTGIPADATILSVTSATEFELSANATATGTATLTFTTLTTGLAPGMPLTGSGISIAGPLTCGLQSSTTVTAASTTGLVVGMQVNAFTGVPAGATIVSIITNTSFVISAAATATDADAKLTFNTIISSVDSTTAITLSNVSTGGAKTGQDLVFEDLTRVGHIGGSQDALVNTDTMMTIATGVTPGASVLFNARRYMGNGTNREFTGLGFKPDLVWIKVRDLADGHMIFDSVRGVTYNLRSDSQGAHSNQHAYGYTSTFNADGFNLVGGSNSGDPHYSTNQPNIKCIAWTWKAGGAIGAGTNATSNGQFRINGETTDRTATSYDVTGSGYAYGKASGGTTFEASYNVSSGFAIIKTTSAGTAAAQVFPTFVGDPSFIIVKHLISSSFSWGVYHQNSIVNGSYLKPLYLNSDSAATTDTNVFGTESVMGGNSGRTWGIGNWSGVNDNPSDVRYIYYIWKAVAGVSAFGTYTGTGGALTVTYTGSNSFTARFIMVKKVSGAGNWMMMDGFRDSGVEWTRRIRANSSVVETSETTIGLTPTSTGFTFDSGTTDGDVNSSGGVYIYCAFA